MIFSKKSIGLVVGRQRKSIRRFFSENRSESQSSIDLYHFPPSTCSWRLRSSLYHFKMNFRLKTVDIVKRKGECFEERNEMNQVPVLQVKIENLNEENSTDTSGELTNGPWKDKHPFSGSDIQNNVKEMEEIFEISQVNAVFTDGRIQ